MVAASHICTHCGYEGSPIRLPSDHSADDESMLVAAIDKLFFAVTFIPFKFGWIVRLAQRGKAKTCPNCGLPLMVKLSSDAGFVAKRKMEVKAGLIKFDVPKKQRRDAFGAIIPEPEETPTAPVVPERLPSLNEMLEASLKRSAPAPEKKPEPQAEPAPKKPIDPEQW